MTATELFQQTFGEPEPALVVQVPGRVNLIGEHIDYHHLPVLPMAIDRGLTLACRPTAQRTVRAVSSLQPGACLVNIDGPHPALAPGDWSNYIAAAIRTAQARWPVRAGLEGAVCSDLPLAAGLSSSSALIAAFVIALLRVNGVTPSVADLMEVLPDGEQLVGTRGGGMDHAAVLASQPGAALYVEWQPIRLTPVPLPSDWSFLVAHSGEHAEKSGALRARYNALREAGLRAQAGAGDARDQTIWGHVLGEAARVEGAREALRNRDLAGFGSLLNQSHESLRDRLKVSTPALDRLTDACREAGAAGARLTGAGFGGCAVAVCQESQRDRLLQRLRETFYGGVSESLMRDRLFAVRPSRGALIAE